MKGNEITIGSIVLYKDKPCTIEGISIGGGVLLRRQNEFVSPRSIDHIWPMPLTPEILEKNGFSIDENGEWYSREVEKKDRNFWINIAFRDDGVAVYDLDVLNGARSSFSMHLNYVHELQKALGLLGIDKDITL